MKTVRSILAVLCGLCLAALCFAGCADSPEKPPAASQPPGSAIVNESEATFIDDLGRSVTVPLRPQRVAALIGSFADVWQLAGGSLAAAANDAWTQFDLDLPETVVNLGATTELSMEKLLAADPDFVIASANTQIDLDWMDTLEAAGIPTAYFDVNDFGEYLRMLEICTTVTGRPDLYQENGLAVQDTIDRATARADGSAPTVLYLRATAVSVKAKSSRDNVLGEMLAGLGCRNIADSDTLLLEELGLERIIADDPDYIFVVEQGSDSAAVRANLERLLLDNPAWSGLTAVQQGRLYYLDQKLYNLKPNARWGEAYEKLAEILYPN